MSHTKTLGAHHIGERTMTLQTAAATPFHAGEQAIQEKLGVRESMAEWGRKVVRTWMPDQHREFYQQLPFVVAADRTHKGGRG